MDNKSLLELKELLSQIDTIEIIKKIESFRAIDLKKISDEDLSNEILKTICVKIENGHRGIFLRETHTIPAKTRFYRVRKLEQEDHYVPLKAMTYEQDAWNAPAEYIKDRGRLNVEHESLLYTSPDLPGTAIEELKITDNEKFCLIVYESKDVAKVSYIGFWEDNPKLTNDENMKMRLINNFLKDEFTRDVGKGTEYLYRVSEMIVKHYFDLPSRVVQDAWCYPSIAAKPAVNVCFRPEIAKELLELVGVQICTVKRSNKGYEFNCIAIASGFDNDKKFVYHPVDSDVCKEKFPEIIVRKK